MFTCESGSAQSEGILRSSRSSTALSGKRTRLTVCSTPGPQTLALLTDAIEHQLLRLGRLHRQCAGCKGSRGQSHRRSLMSRQSCASSRRVNAKPLPKRFVAEINDIRTTDQPSVHSAATNQATRVRCGVSQNCTKTATDSMMSATTVRPATSTPSTSSCCKRRF